LLRSSILFKEHLWSFRHTRSGCGVVEEKIPYMKFILGKKSAMTQYFTEDGVALAATLIEAGPMTVTQIKSKDKDGYVAVQLGYGVQAAHRVNKPQLGAWKDLGTFRHVREFRSKEEATPDAKVGDKVDVSVFAKGDVIVVSGTSKGKGFQGVVKRHGFGGGRRSHGQKHSEREPGAIGGGGRAGGRVAKGMRMAGRMGGDRVTVKNLRVLEVDPTHNLILVSGAVPGRAGTLLELKGE
jgi:large subunit ribosomal protein L3